MIENQHITKCWAWLLTSCCISFSQSSLRTCVSTKSSIGLDSRLRTVACNKKMLSIKYIYIKKQLIKKLDVIKKSYHSLRMWNKWNGATGVRSYETWTRRLWLSVPDCDRWVRHANVMYWMYSAHTASKTYIGMKSFQVAILF